MITKSIVDQTVIAKAVEKLTGKIVFEKLGFVSAVGNGHGSRIVILSENYVSSACLIDDVVNVRKEIGVKVVKNDFAENQIIGFLRFPIENGRLLDCAGRYAFTKHIRGFRVHFDRT